jgi:hypothetical protein
VGYERRKDIRFREVINKEILRGAPHDPDTCWSCLLEGVESEEDNSSRCDISDQLYDGSSEPHAADIYLHEN